MKDISGPFEHEFKFLGQKKSLSSFFADICSRGELLSSRRYLFETVYFDTENFDFRQKGFSLRTRENQNDFPDSSELKAITSDPTNPYSRLELRETNGTFMSRYFNLRASNLYPEELKICPGNLTQIFKVVTDRIECGFEVKLGTETHKLEACSDVIFVTRGDKIFKGPEYEVEVELLSGQPTERLISWIQEVKGSSHDIHETQLSKAERAYRKLYEEPFRFLPVQYP